MNSITLSGDDELLAAIRSKLLAGAERVENYGLKAGGEIIAVEMRKNVNRSDLDSIHIKEDIKVSNIVRKDGMKYVLIGPSRKTGWRGHFLEFGTSKMSAHPFAFPAFKLKKGDALRAMAAEFKKGLISG